MKLLLGTLTDELFSYRIHKKPGNLYEKKTETTTVTGEYFTNNKAYLVTVTHDIALILKHCKETNKTSYNDGVFWLAGPYNLKYFNEVFRSILRNRGDESITPEQMKEEHEYYMDIGPISHYHEERIKKLTDGMGLSITRTNSVYDSNGDLKTSCCFLLISGKMNLTTFLQKIYIFLYAYQYKYSLNVASNEKLEQLKLFFSSWIDEVENKTYLLEELAGKRLYKLSTLDEEYGKQRIEYVENKVNESLHRKRHTIINEIIKGHTPDVILDAGCGSGQILSVLDDFKSYVGIDVDLGKGKRKGDNIKFYQTNLLFPYIPWNVDENSLMVLSEVIEHFDAKDRRRLYYLINHFYQPDTIVITTPNLSYNVNYGLTGYRHNDHKIEFDNKSIVEISQFLSQYTLVKTHNVIEGEQQPSFILEFKRNTEKNVKHHDSIKDSLFYHFPNAREINRTLCNNAIVQNWKEIFYLGPTIAPAESDEEYLESLDKAVQYYHDKGVTDLIYQVKEMGSRAYILWFRDIPEARRYGYDKTIIINSRNGFPFFDDHVLLNQLWLELYTLIGHECRCCILDTEITPWSYKASGLIEKEFNIPLYSEYLHLGFVNNDKEVKQYANVKKAIEELHKFDKRENLKVHIFDVLYFNSPVSHLSIIDKLLRFTPGTRHFAMISTAYRPDFLELDGKEGIVVKPALPTPGILPAIKVRNKDFLRLIYGAHYEEYFKLLADRPLSKKRRMSHQQYKASMEMITHFAYGSMMDKLLSLVVFLSNEKVIDATL